MAVQRNDPYGAFNFLVEVDGVSEPGAPSGGFSEVSGLASEVGVIEYRTGAEDPGVRKLPGLKAFGDVTLARGVIGDLVFWNWAKTALDGAVLRATVAITLLDEGRNPVMRWRLRRAWVRRYVGPRLSARGNCVAIERLVLAHEGLELD
jgi:phage tail-like protein